MGKHYHLFIVTTKKNEFERIYLEMETPEESPEAGLDRYLERELGDRQRNRSKEKERLTDLVESQTVCHPSSWHRAQKENGNGKVTTKKTTRRK